MDGQNIITEKNYPIEIKWVLRSALRSLLSTILFAPFFLSGKFHNIFVIIYFGLIPFDLIRAFLSKLTFHYAIENKFFTLQQGVLSRQQRHIPYGVIQNVLVKQNLLDRLFGLATLNIENASEAGGVKGNLTLSTNQQMPADMIGYSGNMVSIPGLSKQNAETLKNIILQKMKENPMADSMSGL